jgi:hypothetical protein
MKLRIWENFNGINKDRWYYTHLLLIEQTKQNKRSSPNIDFSKYVYLAVYTHLDKN